MKHKVCTHIFFVLHKMSTFEGNNKKRGRDKSSNSNSPPKKKLVFDGSYVDSLDDYALEDLMCTLDLKTLYSFAKTHKRAYSIYYGPRFFRTCIQPKIKESEDDSLERKRVIRYHKKRFALGTSYLPVYNAGIEDGKEVYSMDIEGTSPFGFTYTYSIVYSPTVEEGGSRYDDDSDNEELLVTEENMSADFDILTMIEANTDYIFENIRFFLDRVYELFEDYLDRAGAPRGESQYDSNAYIECNVKPYNLSMNAEKRKIDDANRKLKKKLKDAPKQYLEQQQANATTTSSSSDNNKAKVYLARQVEELAREVEGLVMMTPGDTAEHMKARRACYERAQEAALIAKRVDKNPQNVSTEQLEQVYSGLLDCKTAM
jgi:hypothetical protein